MHKNKRAGVFWLLMLGIAALFAGCKNQGQSYATPLVVAQSDFSEKFSPFFGTTTYDINVSDLTQIGILTLDRLGGIIYNAIEGERVEYNGTLHEYKGAADLKIDYNPNADYFDAYGNRVGMTTYTWKLRNDLKFSDGVDVTADDLIFSFYTLCDPTYAGSTTLSSLDILGLSEYQTQSSAEMAAKYSGLFEDILAAGAGHVPAAGDGWTQAMADHIWNSFNRDWWTRSCDALSEYIVGNYAGSYAQDEIGFSAEEVRANEGLKIAFGMALWGFGHVDNGILEGGETGKIWNLRGGQYPTASDYAEECMLAYEGNVQEFLSVEMDGVPVSSDLNIVTQRTFFIARFASEDPDAGNERYNNIAGIRKLDDYTVEIRIRDFDAAAVYRMGIGVSPLHYYGDRAKYDYNNNRFGFDFGDLSKQESLTTRPMGAGPYKFIDYRDKVVYFEANPYYFKGEPSIKNMQYKVTPEAERVSGILAGTVDISDPSFNKDTVDEIMRANSNGTLYGNQLTITAVDFLGYGYIGINAETINVGGNPSSNASKNLRRAFATIFAVLRNEYCDSYYGERASVINYPISNTSWAAPQATDAGYKVAFSTGANGRDLYISGMRNEDRYAAALEAAREFLEAAGYTFGADGRISSAPAGAKTSYEIIVPADGRGDHPTFQLLTAAKDWLGRLGMELVVNDPSDNNVLWDRLDAGSPEMWCAAWGATIDPDMYQIYHSTSIVGVAEGTSTSNHYHIRDSDLDRLIMDARKTADIPARKAMYKAALDIIIDWAVEIPYYQRQEVFVYSVPRINMNTLTPDITPFWGFVNDIHTLQSLAK